MSSAETLQSKGAVGLAKMLETEESLVAGSEYTG